MPRQSTQAPLRVCKRGGGLGVQINKPLQKALAWNHNDFVTAEVIRGSLVLTKVKFTKALSGGEPEQVAS